MSKDEPALLSARIKPATKKRLEDFCSGKIDDQKHIQENVVEIAINKFIDRQEKLAKMLKD